VTCIEVNLRSNMAGEEWNSPWVNDITKVLNKELINLGLDSQPYKYQFPILGELNKRSLGVGLTVISSA